MVPTRPYGKRYRSWKRSGCAAHAGLSNCPKKLTHGKLGHMPSGCTCTPTDMGVVENAPSDIYRIYILSIVLYQYQLQYQTKSALFINPFLRHTITNRLKEPQVPLHFSPNASAVEEAPSISSRTRTPLIILARFTNMHVY